LVIACRPEAPDVAELKRKTISGCVEIECDLEIDHGAGFRFVGGVDDFVTDG